MTMMNELLYLQKMWSMSEKYAWKSIVVQIPMFSKERHYIEFSDPKWWQRHAILAPNSKHKSLA